MRLPSISYVNLESCKAQHNTSIVDVSDLGVLVETGDLWRFQSFCCHQQWLDCNLGTSSLWRSGTLMQPEVKEVVNECSAIYRIFIKHGKRIYYIITTFDCIKKVLRRLVS